ncbi:High-temperature-induced dauer-formation protein [Phytophthora palmivora]|uniref:High-temperature-induced dauer-formation protein n=1 Tax=Phytophthora palmivora TaxID=4796 RepID=A0A2P4Y8W3_9STRA|nr:High-temperature-induced dauer-formation protein [Phytophthora palmivora]
MGNSDSKSKFRESVYKLNNEVISSKNLEFWDKLWRIPTVAEEIFTLIQPDEPDDVRMLRHQQPENLATMLKQAVSQIVQIVDTPVPKYYQQALNCVRVLTRLVPFILEEGTDEFVEELFWSVEENEEESKEETGGAEPLAKQMIHAIMGILYQTAETCSHWKDRFLEVATALECPFAPTLFYSLLNIVVSYDPVGWGVPYAGSIVSDDRELLVDLSLQVLLVLLDFGQSTESNIPATSKPQPGSSTPAAKRRSSSRPEDFQLIFTGLSRLLNNYHQSMSTLLPNSIKQIKCHQELLVLLWKMLDENTEFLQFVLKKADVNQLVVPLLFLMYEGRQEPAKVGMIHICTFILLLLSGERDFGVNLNKPFNNHLPLDLPPFSGNHADLLIVCLHKIIVSGYEKLNSVYNCFLTIICNISPYCKKLNMVSAVRLLRLFKLFAQPRYLFDNEANHHLVFFLLETFDNIIQYQYEGNQQVVYAMIQNKNVFYQLNDLQLPPIRASTEAKKPAKKEGEADDGKEQETPTDVEFVPTVEWLAAWKKKLPLTTSLRLLQYLIPQLEDACQKAGGSLDEDAMLYFLRTTTMVGLLPVPHPIVIRKYQINQFTHLWFTTFTWGVIFLRNQVLPLFDGGAITLFTISVL